MGSLSLDVRREGGRAIVVLSGDLDLATVPELRTAALAELGQPEVGSLVLDLTGLGFLDSTGLGCWIELRNRAEAAGKHLLLEAVPPNTRRTIAVAGLAPLFGLDLPTPTAGDGVF